MCKIKMLRGENVVPNIIYDSLALDSNDMWPFCLPQTEMLKYSFVISQQLWLSNKIIKLWIYGP